MLPHPLTPEPRPRWPALACELGSPCSLKQAGGLGERRAALRFALSHVWPRDTALCANALCGGLLTGRVGSTAAPTARSRLRHSLRRPSPHPDCAADNFLAVTRRLRKSRWKEAAGRRTGGLEGGSRKTREAEPMSSLRFCRRTDTSSRDAATTPRAVSDAPRQSGQLRLLLRCCRGACTHGRAAETYVHASRRACRGGAPKQKAI
eukprot:363609-Chlamydomonas_euryale.AAC.7